MFSRSHLNGRLEKLPEQSPRSPQGTRKLSSGGKDIDKCVSKTDGGIYPNIEERMLMSIGPVDFKPVLLESEKRLRMNGQLMMLRRHIAFGEVVVIGKACSAERRPRAVRLLRLTVIPIAFTPLLRSLLLKWF